MAWSCNTATPAARRASAVARNVVNQVQVPASPRARSMGQSDLKPQPVSPSWRLQIPPCTARMSTSARRQPTSVSRARKSRGRLVSQPEPAADESAPSAFDGLHLRPTVRAVGISAADRPSIAVDPERVPAASTVVDRVSRARSRVMALFAAVAACHFASSCSVLVRSEVKRWSRRDASPGVSGPFARGSCRTASVPCPI